MYLKCKVPLTNNQQKIPLYTIGGRVVVWWSHFYFFWIRLCSGLYEHTTISLCVISCPVLQDICESFPICHPRRCFPWYKIVNKSASTFNSNDSCREVPNVQSAFDSRVFSFGRLFLVLAGNFCTCRLFPVLDDLLICTLWDQLDVCVNIRLVN